MNSFVTGIGLALLSIGWLAEGAGWPASLYATASAACAALLPAALAYRPHPNDGRASEACIQTRRISRQEVTLVCLAGAIWVSKTGRSRSRSASRAIA